MLNLPFRSQKSLRSNLTWQDDDDYEYDDNNGTWEK